MLLTDNRFSFQALVDRETEHRLLQEEYRINEALMKHGIRFSISPSRNQGFTGHVRYTMAVTFDREVIGRGAGRKPKECPLDMEEAIQKESSGIGKREIASLMGISLSTYYRRRRRWLAERCNDACSAVHGCEEEGSDVPV